MSKMRPELTDNALILTAAGNADGALGIAIGLSETISVGMEISRPMEFVTVALASGAIEETELLLELLGRDGAASVSQLLESTLAGDGSPPDSQLRDVYFGAAFDALRLGQVHLISRWLYADINPALLSGDLLAAAVENGLREHAPEFAHDVRNDLTAYARHVLAAAASNSPAPLALIRELCRALDALCQIVDNEAAAESFQLISELAAAARGSQAWAGSPPGFSPDRRVPKKSSTQAVRIHPLCPRILPPRLLALNAVSQADVEVSASRARVVLPRFGSGDPGPAAQLAARLIDERGGTELAWTELAFDPEIRAFVGELASSELLGHQAEPEARLGIQIFNAADSDVGFADSEFQDARVDTAILESFAWLRASIAAAVVEDDSWSVRLANAGAALNLSNRDLSREQRDQLDSMRHLQDWITGSFEDSQQIDGHELLETADGIGDGGTFERQADLWDLDDAAPHCAPDPLRPTLAELDLQWRGWDMWSAVGSA